MDPIQGPTERVLGSTFQNGTIGAEVCKRNATSLLAQSRTLVIQAMNASDFETLNQTTPWICNGMDMVAKFRDFQAGECSKEVVPVPDIYSKWPTLQALTGRVFRYTTYGSVTKVIRKKNMEDPIAFYLISIVAFHSHYFEFHSKVPCDLNETGGVYGSRLVIFSRDKGQPEANTEGEFPRADDTSDPPCKPIQESSEDRSEVSLSSLASCDVDALLQNMHGQRMGDLLNVKKEHKFAFQAGGIDAGELFTRYFDACMLE
ncbi:MAG: hypothetical protein J3Q66DRAFT_374767 [Benniella sp.]|nr:MAG: hypothetical protein J3Q66DRAFT_374767 [Benniella sp.]